MMFDSVLGFFLAALLWLTTGLAGLTLGAPAGTSTTAAGTPLQFCPSGSGGVCFSIAVPSSSASSGSGNIYFQIKAPSSLQWVALGTGSGMAGSNMFLMYQDGRGNVTMSPRLGTGYTMPALDTSASAARLLVLAGSGLSDDGATVTANVACPNCATWSGGQMSLSSSAAPWIGAWKRGVSLATTDRSAGISEHDGYAQFTVDLSRAVVASDSNPFVAGRNSGGANSTAGGDGQGGSGGASGGSGITETSGRRYGTLLLGHGILLGMVMLFVYPVGAVLIPLFRKWWVHALWQSFGLLAMWVGIILGMVLLTRMQLSLLNPHYILGIIVTAFFSAVPVLGIAHHNQYLQTGRRGVYSHIHRWLARVTMVLGVVNGGLGLGLAEAPGPVTIAYGAVAGFTATCYVGYKLCRHFHCGDENDGNGAGYSQGTPTVAATSTVVPTTDHDTDRSKEIPAGPSRVESRALGPETRLGSRRDSRRDSRRGSVAGVAGGSRRYSATQPSRGSSPQSEGSVGGRSVRSPTTVSRGTQVELMF